MGMTIRFEEPGGEPEAFTLATARGLRLLARWAATLPRTAEHGPLQRLLSEGQWMGTDALAASLRAALDSHRPEPRAVRHTATKLAGWVGVGDPDERAVISSEDEGEGESGGPAPTAARGRPDGVARSADDVRTVFPLDAEFGHIGDHPSYASIPVPPGHPHCRCSMVYALTPEYERMLGDLGPPAPGFEPGPMGPEPNPDRVVKPPRPVPPKPKVAKPRPEPKPVVLPDPKPEPKPVVAKAKTPMELAAAAQQARIEERIKSDPSYAREVAAAQAEGRPVALPGGPIGDRIRDYAVGEVKRQEVLRATAAFDARERELAAEREAISAKLAQVTKDQAPIYAAAQKAMKSGKSPAPFQSQLQGRQAEADALFRRAAEVSAARDAVVAGRAAAVAEVLKVGEPAAIAGKSVGGPFQAFDKQVAQPLGPRSLARVDEAKAWLGQVVARGHRGGPNAGDPDFKDVDLVIGERAGARAHFDAARGPRGFMQIAEGEKTAVIVHEYGHVLDKELKGGRYGERIAWDRSQEFLAHRAKFDARRDIGEARGGKPNREFGRKDKFDAAFGESSAWYVGKDYGRDGAGGGTEILSMGLQKLYEDPGTFAEKDPEYFKFVVGMLDGSLR